MNLKQATSLLKYLSIGFFLLLLLSLLPFTLLYTFCYSSNVIANNNLIEIESIVIDKFYVLIQNDINGIINVSYSINNTNKTELFIVQTSSKSNYELFDKILTKIFTPVKYLNSFMIIPKNIQNQYE